MDGVVKPTEEMRARGGELVASLPAVRIAESDHQRAAVYSFRYSVYVEELGRGVGEIDHNRRWVHDPEDDQPGAVLVYLEADDGGVAGTARLRTWLPGTAPDGVSVKFAMAGIEGLERFTTAEIGRVMVAADRRGQFGLRPLLCALYQLAAGEFGADVAFLTCLSGLVHYYRRIGFRAYDAPLDPTPDGVAVPLVMILSDGAHLDDVGSFLAPMVDAFFGPGRREAIDVARWSDVFAPDKSPVELDAAAVWEEVRRRQGEPHPESTFLDALDERTIHLLCDHGFLLRVRAGQLLIRKGLVQQELFVILDGTSEIRDGERVLRVVGPGDVIGEVGFFGTAGRRSASVITTSDGRLLVLRRRSLDDLRRSDPGPAADILFGLARALADRMFDAPA